MSKDERDISPHTLRLEAIAYTVRRIDNAAVGKYLKGRNEDTYDSIAEELEKCIRRIKRIVVPQDECLRPWCDDEDECVPCGGN